MSAPRVTATITTDDGKTTVDVTKAITGHNGVNVGQLRSLVERIERLDADIKDLNTDKSEVFKEAKSAGYDTNIIRKIVKARAMDDNKRKEEAALFELYADALGVQMGLPL